MDRPRPQLAGERGVAALGAAARTTPPGYERLWYAEAVGSEEVAFESSVFLLTKARCEELRSAPETGAATTEATEATGARPGSEADAEPASRRATGAGPGTGPGSERGPDSEGGTAMLRLAGTVPPELWNRLGTRVIPKLRSGDGLTVGIDLTVAVAAPAAGNLEADLRQALADLGFDDRIRVDRS